MNTKLSLKGILLYVTITICILAIGGIDSIYDKGYLIETIIIILSLIYLCKKVITREELKILLP